uniref:Uncharacterized protein n=1 Tax=Arundo donax TaxID=35708 RepID=A0A0A9HUH8_ARUDO
MYNYCLRKNCCQQKKWCKHLGLVPSKDSFAATLHLKVTLSGVLYRRGIIQDQGRKQDPNVT